MFKKLMELKESLGKLEELLKNKQRKEEKD